MRFQRTNFLVSDLDRALVLYRDILGMKVDLIKESEEDSYSYEQMQLSSDRVGIAKKSKITAWSGPFIMAVANTRVVRRTEALLALRQESYGSNFTYQEHAFHKSWVSAFKSLVITGISVLVLISPLKRAVKPFLPKQGEGTSETSQAK